MKKAVPDCNGKLFCHACDTFLPVNRFKKTGPRRYYCTVHIRSLFHKRGIKELAMINLSKRLHRDLIGRFGKAVILFSQAELLSLIAQVMKTPDDYHQLCMLPCDPQDPVTTDNVFLATKEQHKFLVALYQLTGDMSEYRWGVCEKVCEKGYLIVEWLSDSGVRSQYETI